MKNYILRLFSFFLISSISYSQEISKFLPDILPPPPASYSLGKYGNVPVGQFTGSTNVNIPVLSYKTQHLEMPIYLSYSNNGIKVNEHESIVGLGWNLNMGGIITRIVRDKPDDEINYIYSGPPKDMLDELHPKSPEVQQYIYLGQGQVDTEDDLFFINVNGISGKFHIIDDNEVQLVDNQNIKVEFESILSPTDPTYYFIITDQRGVKYYFGEVQSTQYRISGNGGPSPPSFYYSSWYLTKIAHPNGEEINLSYTPHSSQFVMNQSQTMTRSWPSYQSFGSGISYIEPPYPSVIYNHNMTINNKLVDTISSNNPKNGRIVITYDGNFIDKINKKDDFGNNIEEFNFIHSTTANNRTFLDKIVYENSDKSYRFKYIDKEDFPPRLSFAQDHWGYFNGSTSNSNLIPANLSGYTFENYNFNGANREPSGTFAKKGMLEYIYYPTKGHTKLEYEPHDYYGEKILPEETTSENLSLHIGNTAGQNQDIVQIFSPVDQKVIIYGSANFDPYYDDDCTENQNTGFHHRGSLSVYCVEDQNYITFFDTSYNQGTGTNVGTSVSFSAPASYYVNLSPNKTYKFTLSVSFMCTSAGVGFSYISATPTTVDQNIPIAGIRVKRTTDYISQNDPSPKIKRYYYSKINELNKSSGNKGQKPFYFSKGYKHIDNIPVSNNTGIPVYGTTVNFVSSSLSHLFDTGRSNVYYQYVTVSYGGDNFENGGKEFEYTIDRDYFGETINYSVPLVPTLDDSRSAPWTNFGWNNGDEIKRKVFNKNLNLIKEKETVYETIPLSQHAQYNIRVELPYQDVAGIHYYNCSETDISHIYSFYECTTSHTHFSVNPSYFYCIANNANNVPAQSIEHSCYQKPIGSTVSHNYENKNVTVTKYKNLSYYKYPKKIVEKNHLGNNTISTTTKNYVRNDYPFLVSKQIIEESTGDSFINKFYYPMDLPGVTFMDELIEQSRIGQPIKTEVYKDNNKNGSANSNEILSSKRTVFINDSGLVLPGAVETSKEGNNNFEPRVIFQDYDLHGNLLEVSKSDGSHIRYIWGYGQCLPIAKIENYNSFAIADLETNLQNISNADDDRTIGTTGSEGTLREALRNLRNHPLLSKSMVTTYTYDPLVGITSKTDPRGNTVYYEYDDLNRLKQIKDDQGHLLKSFDYNYREN